MSYIFYEYIIMIMFTLLMVCNFASKIEDEITNSIESMKVVTKIKDMEPKKHSLEEFKIEIHHAIFSFLDTKHQGFYSLLNSKLLQSKLREFYLCKRTEDVLIYGREGEKSNVYVDPFMDSDSGFDKYFRLRMENLPEIDAFFSRTREKLSELWEFNGTIAMGIAQKYFYSTIDGKMHYHKNAKDIELDYLLPTFPLAIKFTVDDKQYIEFLRRYYICPRNFSKSAVHINFMKLQQNDNGNNCSHYVCEFNYDASLDKLTDVKEIIWRYQTSLGSFLTANYIIADNKLERKTGSRSNDANLSIESCIFSDFNSPSNFKIVNHY